MQRLKRLFFHFEYLRCVSFTVRSCAIFVVLQGCHPKTHSKQNPQSLVSIKDSSVKLELVRDVAYGYEFALAEEFVEEKDTVGQVDSCIYYSQDRRAKLKYFVGNELSNKDSPSVELQKYMQDVENGKLADIPKCKILHRFLRHDSCYFVLEGWFKCNEFILKTQLGQVPVDGNPILKSMLFY